MSSRRTVLVAAIALILITPVAMWAAVGDLSEDVPDPDYMIRPIELPGQVEGVVRVGSVALAAIDLGVLVVAAARREFDPAWRAPTVLLVAAGVITGFGWRVVTAGVIGANIGGAMVIPFGGPIVLGLVIAGVLCAAIPPGRRRAPR